jgi:magnesium chelatase subunit I
LKDRFGAEIRTHYPLRLADEVALIRQEAAVRALVPVHLMEVVARFTRLVRESTAVDSRSGVSARFAVAAAESLAASALRRAAITGETAAVARVGDLPAVVPTLRGKVEFEVSEEGREEEILIHLQRRAVAETFRAHLGGVDLSALIARIDEGDTIEVGDLVTAEAMLTQLGPVEGLGRIVTALEGESASESPGLAASALETALEGLYLTRRISKDEVPGGGRAVYGGRES